MKFKMKVKTIGGNKESFWEEYDTLTCRLLDDDEDDPKVAAKKIVDYYNRTLRPNEKPRKLLAVKRIE